MAIDYQGIVTHGLAIQIATKIREAILEGRLKVDERLPTEEELASRFSVSRPTIREALKRLAAQNLIRSRRGPTGGTFVKQPNRQEARLAVANAATLFVSLGEFSLQDIAEARTELELVCCRLAAARRTDEHLVALAAEIERQRLADLSDEEFCASDVRFHNAIVDAAGNPALDFAAAAMLESLQPAVNMVIFRFRKRAKVAEQHQRLYLALAARDADGACRALTEYMLDLRKQYAQAQAARARSTKHARPPRRA
ncbi:MAG TPA: FadR/GntR family transcriptional regulator [Steroidobacteraceae bacterium]|nr:FadR/GntR family transcriptional regulator [Steroidobacteraceae bacterium]